MEPGSDQSGFDIEIWEPGLVKIHEGAGIHRVRRIVDNTADTITVAEGWGIVPDETSVYEVINTSTWTIINDVSGDNENSDGTTNITWNLE